MMRTAPVHTPRDRQPASRGLGQPSMPLHPGPAPVYLPCGPFPESHHVVLKHHLKLERERAGEGGQPALPPSPGWQDYQLVEDE